MIKPVSYLQSDTRWANSDYSAPGEKTTIGKSGCGPSCMAMILATFIDATITPKATCAWARTNGYKAPNQGTYYTYFVPQGAKYGVKVSQVNTSNIYGSSGAAASHKRALDAIKAGNYVICCMGKGNWTSSGHFILWYGIDGDQVLVNDPNSTKAGRIKAALSLLQAQVKYYFIVEVADLKAISEMEEDDMDETTVKKIINEVAEGSRDIPSPWAKDAVPWAVKKGYLSDATNLDGTITKEELATVLFRVLGGK